MEDILLFLFKINNLIKFFIIINSDLQSAPSAQTQVLIDKQSQKRKEMQFKVSFIYQPKINFVCLFKIQVLEESAEINHFIHINIAMKLREIKSISTNITSSLDVSADQTIFSLITRKLAVQSSKYQYQLSIYNLADFELLAMTEIYETYSEQKHPSKILADGETVVVATRYHIIFYDIDSLDIKYKALHEQMNVYGLEASHDGKIVAMVGDNIVKMWNSANFKPINFPFLIPRARNCHFSYDNRYFGVSSTTNVTRYEIQGINMDYDFITRSTTPDQLQFGTVSSFQFNPQNSQQIVVGFSNISPRLFSFNSGVYSTILGEQFHEQQPQYYDNYKEVYFMPDGERVISSDYTEGVGIWPGKGGKLFYKENYLYFGTHPFKKGQRAIGFVWQRVKILQIVVKCKEGFKTKCKCDSGSAWNQRQYKCVKLACKQVLFSTGKVLKNKCQCKPNYVWNESLRKCVLNCKDIQNTVAMNPINSFFCYCKPGFFWKNNKCEFSCSDIIFSTGVATSKNSCECILGWAWQQETRSCACLPYSIKNIDGTCACMRGYILNPALNQCVVDCQSLGLENSSGKNDGNDKCECNEGYYFGLYINSNLDEEVGCRRNCTFIENALEETIQLDKCLCGDNMDYLQGYCVANCSKIKNAVKTKDEFNLELNQTQVTCKCATNYVWVAENRECGRNCTSEKFINETGISTSLTCPCINAFNWDIYNNMCKIDCEEVQFTQSYSIENHYSCECRQFFVWNKNEFKCLINCSEIYDADERIQDGKCSCKNDKKFNNTGLMCQATIAEEAFSSPWFIAVLAAGVVFVIVVACIMVRFCFKFKTEDNKEHKKRLKTSLDPKKSKKKKKNEDEDIMEGNIKSAERMKF